MWQRESCKRLFIRYCLATNSFLIVETAAVNLKPLALSLSKGEQAYGLRQAQPERLFQEQRGRLNSNKCRIHSGERRNPNKGSAKPERTVGYPWIPFCPCGQPQNYCLKVLADVHC